MLAFGETITDTMRAVDEDQKEEECQERDPVYDDGLWTIGDW